MTGLVDSFLLVEMMVLKLGLVVFSGVILPIELESCSLVGG